MGTELYSVALRITGPASGAPFVSIATASTKPIIVREVGLVLVAATSSSVGLVRAATVGAASTSTAGQPHRTLASAPTASVKSAWSDAPTIAGSPVYMRRLVLPATIGASVTWENLAMHVEPSAALLLWNFGGGAASDVDLYVTWEEAN
jgi:hypothetical protein